MTLQILLWVWRTQVIDNLFIFRESEKSLKETPLGLFSWWKVFTSLKRIRKRLETLILGFWSMIKVSKQTLEDFFCFSKVWKSFKKIELPHRHYCLFLPLQDLKTTISFPKYSKNDFMNYIKGYFYKKII